MNKNIFEGAKFGEKFLCRDGKEAYFSHTFWSAEDNERFVILMVPIHIITEYNQDAPNYIIVSLDGSWHRKKYESDNDIVSRYQESVDEETLAKKMYPISNEYIDYQYGYEDINKQKRVVFIAG